MAVAQLVEPSVYTGTTCKFSFTSKLPAGNSWSACCWAYQTGNAATYHDLIAISDDNDVIGIGTILSGATYNLNLGDLNSDQTSARVTPRNEWHHYAIVVIPNGANTQVFGYVDGIQQLGPVSLAAPPTPTALRLWNSRASTTDTGSQYVGHACAFKVWDGVQLTDKDIFNEMPFYRAQKREGLFAEVPCVHTDMRTLMTGGRALDLMAVTGTFTANAFDPPGVSWDSPLARRRPATYFVPGPAAICHYPGLW